jgi:glycosyltransferase involved in cell wall biosynthesis
MHVAHALTRSGEFDLVHNHLDWLPLAFAAHCDAPLLTTIHGFSGPKIQPAYARAKSAYVSISNADRAAGLDYAATVYHGVDFDTLPFAPDGGPGLVAFGRIHPDKGTHTAIEIALLAGRPLTICGIVQDERYFTEEVAPHIDGDRITYLGSVGPQRRGEILGASAALLHPIAFDEPFGLSVVESMACGTPVVAYRRGSMPEVVDEGVTGFLVHTSEQAAMAVARIATIDRAGCRTHARQRFSADRMVTDYLRVYSDMRR